MIEKNYEEFDYMRLIVKNEVFDKIVSQYAFFGWEVDEVKEGNEFFETKELTLKRKHKICQKDKLQLEQVYMENEYVKLDKLIRTKYAFSSAFGLTVGLLTLALIVCNIFFAVRSGSLVVYILSGIIFAVGLVILAMLLYAVFKIKKREENDFLNKTEQIKKKITEISMTAKQLLESDENGED